MRIVGVIPSRWSSTRLPGKSLIPLCGKPLVLWVAERASQARRLGALVVATDDERIRKAVTQNGFRAVMTRADHGSGTERAAEAVAGENADIVINIQGDEPLIDPALIDAVAEATAGECDMATAATPIESERDLESRAVVKVVWGREGYALYFSRSVIPCVRDSAFRAAGPVHWRHIGIYGYRKAFLDRFVATPPCLLEEAEKLEQLRALHMGGKIRVIQTPYAGVGVDTPEDVVRAEAAIRKAGLAK
jgi:3-deoxy-manno-octulosonate cytidylyltransferase (CMP-KDO synthetase)